MVLRKKLTVLLLAVMMVVLAMMAPAVNAAPSKSPNPNFGGNDTSTEHRNNASGKGNFGQCHRTGVVEGQDSREYTPSAVNRGEADCRQAGMNYALVRGACEDPAEAPPPGPREEPGPPEECVSTEAQLGFQ